MRTFFTSDTHFGHENIIKYCKRPFANAKEMDKVLVQNWNKVVGPDDLVYHLGDFAVGGGPAGPYLDQLNGKIILIHGNHDERIDHLYNPKKMKELPLGHPKLFQIAHFMEIKVNVQALVPTDRTVLNKLKKKFFRKTPMNKDFVLKPHHQDITLCHYAMKVWNKAHHGAWQLFGHSHGTLPDDPNALQLDVGVDSWDFTPVTVEQIYDRMALKNFKPIDHHDKKVAGPRALTLIKTPTGRVLKSA
jgi:calcineurin-like phosphoesterase family protein